MWWKSPPPTKENGLLASLQGIARTPNDLLLKNDGFFNENNTGHFNQTPIGWFRFEGFGCPHGSGRTRKRIGSGDCFFVDAQALEN